jgi:tetratricopeptide (TPR) repeat protein
MALDLASLWDFDNPELSAERFRRALETATGDDRLILYTQIARTRGLRSDFEGARALLHRIEPELEGADPEAHARYALELGRTYASAAHDKEEQTRETQELARSQYLKALKIAEKAGLDALAIDAVHMLAFVDTAPADQLKWGQKALALSLGSTQPAATRWEASIRNNIGYALHQLGRYDEALAEFQRALALREAGTNQDATRIAHWMVAWTLRALKRNKEALAIQLRLLAEGEAAGAPSPFVLEELEQLYSALGDEARARSFAQRRKALAD